MTPISSITDPKERLLAFARERHAIYLRRQTAEGDYGPATESVKRRFKEVGWTSDPILREYRFCNVYRENDKVTRWIADHWRTPHADDPDLWFAMVVARFVNWPETLAEIGWPVPWNRDHFLQVMRGRRDRGLKNYTGAYMVRAESGTPGLAKFDYQADAVFGPMWDKRKQLRPKAGDTLNSYHMLLGQFHGLGSFMAAQVVADLKYVEPLKSASDWWTFAASGPGSRRGLNRVLGFRKDQTWNEDNWRMENERLRLWFNERWVQFKDHYPLHAQDIQNVLCEFDKFERVRLGEGRPRARYHATAS